MNYMWVTWLLYKFRIFFHWRRGLNSKFIPPVMNKEEDDYRWVKYVLTIIFKKLCVVLCFTFKKDVFISSNGWNSNNFFSKEFVELDFPKRIFSIGELLEKTSCICYLLSCLQQSSSQYYNQSSVEDRM